MLAGPVRGSSSPSGYGRLSARALLAGISSSSGRWPSSILSEEVRVRSSRPWGLDPRHPDGFVLDDLLYEPSVLATSYPVSLADVGEYGVELYQTFRRGGMGPEGALEVIRTLLGL